MALYGLYRIHARVVSWYLQFPLVIVYLAAIILTAVRRYNKMGSLAAMSLAHVFPEGIVASKRTYADDGERISSLFAQMCILCILQVSLVFLFSIPPKKKEIIPEAKQAINDDDDF